MRRLAEAAASWGEPLNAAALKNISSLPRLCAREERGSESDRGRRLGRSRPQARGRRSVAASVLRPLLAPAPKILDLGAGAGFIGIALKLVWPEAEVTLMESVERKYRFLNAAATRTGLKGLRVLNRPRRLGRGAHRL